MLLRPNCNLVGRLTIPLTPIYFWDGAIFFVSLDIKPVYENGNVTPADIGGCDDIIYRFAVPIVLFSTPPETL